MKLSVIERLKEVNATHILSLYTLAPPLTLLIAQHKNSWLAGDVNNDKPARANNNQKSNGQILYFSQWRYLQKILLDIH